ncbi:MAG: flagellar motor protein MotB [Bacillota bacterium]
MRRKRNSSNKNQDGGGSPAWMTTFGDMMTLLLVFFVLLYSFSSLDVQKFKGFISALQNQLGVLEGGKTIIDAPNITAGDISEDLGDAPQNLGRVMEQMQEYIDNNNLNDRVNIDRKRKGLVISLTGEILYDLGRADLKAQGEEVLTMIAENLKELPNDIMIEGHTDYLPINNQQYPSNWELSTARAVNVIKYLIEEKDFTPSRLSAAGYSKYRPVVDENNPEALAKNRRVEIVILNSQYGIDQYNN